MGHISNQCPQCQPVHLARHEEKKEEELEENEEEVEEENLEREDDPTELTCRDEGVSLVVR